MRQYRRPWAEWLAGDPTAWLLEETTPAVRAATLQWLFDRPPDDPDVVAARRAALRADPIRAIVAAQHSDAPDDFSGGAKLVETDRPDSSVVLLTV